MEACVMEGQNPDPLSLTPGLYWVRLWVNGPWTPACMTLDEYGVATWETFSSYERELSTEELQEIGEPVISQEQIDRERKAYQAIDRHRVSVLNQLRARIQQLEARLQSQPTTV
jgi:hypothetical protein